MKLRIDKTKTHFSLSINDWLKVNPVTVSFIRKTYLHICLLIVASIASASSWYYYYSTGYSLSYNDARSHLNVSRRVVDSLQPGLAQLGSVWLPLQHVLALPFVWIDPLYRTGLAGSLVSMVAYVGCCVLLYEILLRMGVGELVAFVVSLAFCANQNLLFIQSTPMTEPLMLFTMMLAIFFLSKWVIKSDPGWLILAGIATFFATLTRYDGWFFFIVATGLVAGYSWYVRGRAKAESAVLLYATVGALGIFLWMVWNKLIFGDWLFFMNGPFSAKAQQDLLYQAGRLLTRGNMWFSAVTYFWSMWFNIGFPMVIFGILGFVKLMWRRDIRQVFIGLLLFSTIAFNILSLYGGQSVIHLPNLPPHTWFNVRYGLMALPAMAFGMAIFVEKRKLAALLCFGIVAAQAFYVFKTNQIITIQDGVRGSSGYFLDDIGAWVHDNADDGLILVAASSHDALLFISGLPIKNFITEGAEKYWVESMTNPQTYAKYIVMHEGDIVERHMKGNPNFEGHYQLVYEGQFSNVYKRIE